MTIPLASAWLHGDKRNVITTVYDKELRRHLELPTHFNPHSTYAEIDKIAERIVFTNDIPSLLYDLSDNDQVSFKGILRTTRLPYDCFWLEYKVNYKDETMYFGALVRKLAGDRVRMIVVSGYPYGNDIRCGVTYVIEFKHWPPVFMVNAPSHKYAFGFDLFYSFNEEEFSSTNKEAQFESVAWMLIEIIFGIFLITQPKTYVDECIKPSNKLQHARERRGKPPLLEYRRINMRIGKAHKHYKHGHYAAKGVRVGDVLNRPIDLDSDDAIRRRRYHKVMGHFRHYVNGDNPHTVWIEPHYRGDPQLGVTFTERDVMR